jgi:NAD(P)H-nitrite reductase large subunit
MPHHLIIGAGPAGVVAAETLRQHAPNDTITLVGDEPQPPYSRMAIPYLLMGQIQESGTHLRQSATHWQDLNVFVRQARVRSVLAPQRQVVLQDGARLSFDTLLIATGSRPVIAPVPGIDAPGVHTCWTLQDARHIMALATAGACVLQLGAGFIGCIIMEALAARGVKLSVVEMGDRMVPRMMGPTAGGMIRDWCQAKGVQVFTRTKVQAITPGKPLTVHLSGGQQIQADLVISAAGVQPNIDFLAQSGIACATGVLADAHMQTNVPGVLTAGDCAQALDKASGAQLVSAIQPNAVEQARVAALNMLAYAHHQTPAAELPCVTQINVLDTLGLISSSFGAWAGVPGGDHVEWTDAGATRHLNLQFKDDVLVGCNSVGWTAHVGAMRGLVEGRVKLGPWKNILKNDPTQLMQAYLARAWAQGQWRGAQDARRRTGSCVA